MISTLDYTEFVDHQAETIDGDSALSVSGVDLTLLASRSK